MCFQIIRRTGKPWAKKLTKIIFLAMFLVAFANELYATEINFKSMFENLGAIMMISDVETGNILYVNQEAVDFYGFSREQLLTMSVQDINTLTPAEVEWERRAAVEEGRNFYLFSHRLADGQVRNVEVYTYPFLYDGRQRLYSVIHDVTARIQLEQQLNERNQLFRAVLLVLFMIQLIVIMLLMNSKRISREAMRLLEISEKKYKSLFDNLQEGFDLHEVICDETGTPVDSKYLDVNKAFENMIGFKREDIISKRVSEVFPDFGEKWLKRYWNVALEGNVDNFEVYSKEMGKHFVVTVFSPEKERFASVFFDITERKVLENTLLAEKERLRITLMSVGDGVITANKEGKIELMNNIAQHLTGWSQEEARGEAVKEVFHIINEKTRMPCENPVEKVLESGQIIGLANHTLLIARDGVERSIADSAAPITDAKGEVQGVVVVFRDVTNERNRQMEIEYLSYHDSLTGLYNRRYFEEELRRLDVERNLPLSVIMGDVNGLKLINDAFGHFKGDTVLQKVAKALKSVCRSDDIIARWGGDEFVILLPKTNQCNAAKVIQRAIAASAEMEVASIRLSISLGHATKEKSDDDIMSILKAAESEMYKNKLRESQSVIGQAIRVIHGTLLENNSREAQHSRRVADICKEISLAMGFSEAAVSEMETIGLMHDIGKIAIKETILNKATDLTASERSEINRHPEIGYRVLSSSNDTADIARHVLAHHERYDGKGYPSGKKGKEIPEQSRILAVADAFDAMTTERTYRAPLSKNEVIEELRKNAGTQFDPLLVQLFIEKVLDKLE